PGRPCRPYVLSSSGSILGIYRTATLPCRRPCGAASGGHASSHSRSQPRRKYPGNNSDRRCATDVSGNRPPTPVVPSSVEVLGRDRMRSAAGRLVGNPLHQPFRLHSSHSHEVLSNRHTSSAIMLGVSKKWYNYFVTVDEQARPAADQPTPETER